MTSFNYVITDEVGIHARPAGLLVKAAKAVSSKVVVKSGARSADATKLMAIMGLGVKKGTEVTVEITGENETADAAVIETFFKENL
ncbi:MAG: HPr family phosphocarrier protein [Clostridiales bacterium]|nr:HPr family phosphocarrier protein [Clostridiales bacterium]